MFFRILKLDLKKRKLTNTLLLLFIILATIFAASGLNNVAAVMNGTDYYLERNFFIKEVYEEKTRDVIIQEYIPLAKLILLSENQFIKEKVIPELQKLGLEHLIPELQEALIEKYKEKLHNLDIIKHEDMYKYVPDFSQISEESDQPDLDTEKVSTEFGIESYEQIDSEVRPSQRNAVIKAIKQEQEPEKSSPGKIIGEGTEVEENT